MARDPADPLPAPAAPTTAAPDEVARFEAAADGWWDERSGAFRPLHRFNAVRVDYLRDRAARHFGRAPTEPLPLRDLRALDVGCGGGLLAEPLTRLGARVTGIDAGAANVRVARAHAADQGLAIDYRVAAPEDLAAAGEPGFDLVLAMEVVEHAADPDAFVAACAALVRPGGALAMASLNRTARAFLLGKVGAEYVLGWLPRGTHDWKRFVKPSEAAAGLRAHGLRVADVRGVAYAPLSGGWRLAREPAVNYLLFATRD